MRRRARGAAGFARSPCPEKKALIAQTTNQGRTPSNDTNSDTISFRMSPLVSRSPGCLTARKRRSVWRFPECSAFPPCVTRPIVGAATTTFAGPASRRAPLPFGIRSRIRIRAGTTWIPMTAVATLAISRCFQGAVIVTGGFDSWSTRVKPSAPARRIRRIFFGKVVGAIGFEPTTPRSRSKGRFANSFRKGSCSADPRKVSLRV